MKLATNTGLLRLEQISGLHLPMHAAQYRYVGDKLVIIPAITVVQRYRHTNHVLLIDSVMYTSMMVQAITEPA